MPTKIGVGVNECVLLETSQGRDYLLQSTGLAGCVLAIVTLDPEYCFVAHALDYNGFPEKGALQEKELFEFCEQLPPRKPTSIVVASKGFMGQPSKNMTRIAGVLKKAFPSSPPPEYKFCNGVQVVLNENSCWKIVTDGVDYSKSINTNDVAKNNLPITRGVLMSDPGEICVAESATG